MSASNVALAVEVLTAARSDDQALELVLQRVGDEVEQDALTKGLIVLADRLLRVAATGFDVDAETLLRDVAFVNAEESERD